MVVINHGYMNGWHSDRPVVEQDGLLAVQIEKAGTTRISLRYMPGVFIAGLIISMLSLITAVAAPPIRGSTVADRTIQIPAGHG